MDWYLKVLKDFRDFDGRARRKEFWMFTLVGAIIGIFISCICAAIDSQILSWLYSLLMLLPNLSVTCRRLHDIDRSGWWMLLSLVPIAGIVVLVFLCTSGTPGPNLYGPDPLEGEAM